MLRIHRNILVLISLLVVAALSAPAAFVTASGPGTVDTSVFGTLVDFNNAPLDPDFPDYGTQVTSTESILVFDDGTLSVNFSVPNYSPFAEQVRYGSRTHPGQTPGDASPYIVNDSGAADLSAGYGQQLEFNVTGGLVAAIGIHISTIHGAPWLQSLSTITLEIYGVGGVLLESFEINSTSSPVNLAGLQEPSNNPENAGFYGFSRAENDIAGFRIIGGPILVDNLRFGLLDAGEDPGNGGGPGNPSAVPEASTFLLCGGVLTMLAMIRRRRTTA